MIFVASINAAVIASFVVFRIAPPLPKLSRRLAPYDTVSRVRLGAQVSTQGTNYEASFESKFFMAEYFKPLYQYLNKALLNIFSFEDSKALSLKLKQAGMQINVESYRTKILRNIFAGIALGIILGASLKNVTALLFFPAVIAFAGYSKSKATVDKKIEHRKQLIRSELYTINQLLALHIRTGSGVTQALTNISRRTTGMVSQEISNVLSRVRSGMALEESLYLESQETPEPHAVRTFKLLAASSTRGVDLTQGLLDLAKDLRRSLREEVKANGAKRRAAMLLPTIGILAPIMLLFVAAPIPNIILGGR